MFLFVVFFIRYVPTADDIEMYKSNKGDLTELHVVDQYMMEVIAEIMDVIYSMYVCVCVCVHFKST